MVPIANNSVHQISDTHQNPNAPIRSRLPASNPASGQRRGQVVNSDEPLIDVVDEPGGPDPLLIDETGDPNNQWILLDCNSPKKRKSYRKRIAKVPKRLVKVRKILKTDSDLPLERSMVHEALRARGSIGGAGVRELKRFLAKKYGVEFESEKILKELQAMIASGVVRQFKNRNRYRLVNGYSKKLQVTRETDGNEKNASVEKAIGSDRQETDTTTDVKDFNESVLDDIMMKGSSEGGIEMVDSSPSARENTVDVKLDSALPNEKSVDVLDLESKVEKVDFNPIHKDEIDFMVLHSIYCSPNKSGMRLDEIAAFIYSFYDIDAHRSLPYIRKYLDFGIDNGILYKTGDRYQKGFGTYTFNSQRYSYKRVKQSNDSGNASGVQTSSSSSKNFSLSNVKSDAIKIANSSSSELVSNPDGAETKVNDNVIESMGEKQVAEKVTNKSYNLRDRSQIRRKDVSPSEKKGNELLSKTSQHHGTPSQPAGPKELDIAKTASPHRIRVETKCNKKRVNAIEQPFVSYIRGEVVPFSSKSIKAEDEKQDESQNVMSQLKVAFQSIKFSKQNLSDSHFEEHDLPQSLNPPGLNLMDEHQSKFNFPVDFDEPKYILPEIDLHLSRYPKTILNTPAADVFWERIEIRKNFSCLKLTGTSSPSDENLNCTFCDAELEFGQGCCKICLFVLQSKIEKCNVCHFLCNRGDVFYKHFIWEHRPLTQEADEDSVSVIEQNLGSLLNKLANNNLFRCRLCTFLTNTIDAFETHIIVRHTSKINVFPPLPEYTFSDGAVIFQNEIENTCCHRCEACGFISNQTDYMVYHILNLHGTYNNQYFGTDVEPKKKTHSGKVNWSSGLCHVCGKLYGNITEHLIRHQIMRPSKLRVRPTRDLDEVELHIRREMLLLQTDERVPKTRRKRKIDPNKTFLCHICGMIVKCRLCAHLRIHNYTLYDCNICGKQFNRQSNLLTHRRVHTREKPFQCDICKMMFGYKCSIKGHIINVHSETVK